MKIKKGRDLKVGDVVENYGVIGEINLNPDPDGFWGGKPNIMYYCYHDSYYGPHLGELSLDREFKVFTDIKQIVKILKRVDSDMAKYIADTMQHRKEFQELKMKVVTKLNKKMRGEMKGKYSSECES